MFCSEFETTIPLLLGCGDLEIHFI